MTIKERSKQISVYINTLNDIKRRVQLGLVIEDIYTLDEQTLKELNEVFDRRLKQLTEDLQEV